MGTVKAIGSSVRTCKPYSRRRFNQFAYSTPSTMRKSRSAAPAMNFSAA